MLSPPILQQGIDHPHAVGVEKGEAWTFVMETEQTKFPPQPPMVTLLGQFDLSQVLVQLLLGGERSAVDSR